jgi:REP element-mobilizing transposase RayT
MSYTQLNYHLVFSTKDRRPWLGPEVMPRLREYLGGIIRNLGGQMLAANGPADHVHLATILNQKRPLMEVLQELKQISSKWIHQEFPDLRAFAWQDGYAAFTVSHSGMPQVVAYIAQQVPHHHRQTFVEELIALLERHGVQYDERYITT